MSDWTPTEEQVEKHVRAGWDFEQQVAIEFGHQTAALPFESLPEWAQDTHRDKARAVLAAVGPSIAAQALRDAAEVIPGSTSTERIDPCDLNAEWLIDHADQIEEAGR